MKLNYADPEGTASVLHHLWAWLELKMNHSLVRHCMCQCMWAEISFSEREKKTEGETESFKVCWSHWSSRSISSNGRDQGNGGTASVGCVAMSISLPFWTFWSLDLSAVASEGFSKPENATTASSDLYLLSSLYYNHRDLFWGDLNVELLQPESAFCIRKQIWYALPVDFLWCTQTHWHTHVHIELFFHIPVKKKKATSPFWICNLNSCSCVTWKGLISEVEIGFAVRPYRKRAMAGDLMESYWDQLTSKICSMCFYSSRRLTQMIAMFLKMHSCLLQGPIRAS